MASTQRVGSRRGPQRPLSLQRRAPVPDIARGAMLALIALANVMICLHDRPYGVRQHIHRNHLQPQSCGETGSTLPFECNQRVASS